MADNKHWATDYVVNPLHEPAPAEETGPGSSFRLNVNTTKPINAAPISVQNTGSSTSTNPFRRHRTSTSNDTTPTGSRAPTLTNNPSSTKTPTTHVRDLSARDSISTNQPPTRGPSLKAASTRRSIDATPAPSSTISSRASTITPTTRPRRASSLRAQHPGDTSAYPLDTLRASNKKAYRSPHLRKKHHHGSDSIDKLDLATVGGAYHHEGPYDAASLARNLSSTSLSAPVAALSGSNREALRATPRESVRDSVERRRPLDNVAVVPPGGTDAMGRVYHYREGPEEDAMRWPGGGGGGAYKRFEGVEYHPNDLKGKGEPSYTIEKQLKDHKISRKAVSGPGSSTGHDTTQSNAVELADRSSRGSSVREQHHRSGRDSNASYRDRAPPPSDLYASPTAAAEDVNGRHAQASELEATPVGSTSFGSTSARSGTGQSYGEWEKGHRRDISGGGAMEGMKRRIGSLRRKDREGAK